MATLNELRLPDELLRALERRASAHGVSVEVQLVRDLESVNIANCETGEADLIGSIRRDREGMAEKGVHLTDDFLKVARNWGRK